MKRLVFLLVVLLWGCHASTAESPQPVVSGVQPTQLPAVSTQPAEGLQIGHAHPGGLLIGAYAADKATPGLCAIGPYSRTRMPPFPTLYDWAVKGNVAQGSNELIGRLPGEVSTPIQIMESVREGNEFKILVALAPKKPDGSNYIWGELPQNLPAGRYHVVLTGTEYQEENGKLVPAPAMDVRVSYQLECYFVVGGTPEEDAAWNADGEAVVKTFGRLEDRLKFLKSDFPKIKPDDTLEFFRYAQRTASGDITADSLQFQYNWDLGMPRTPPAPGTSGMALFINAYRHDDRYLRPIDYTLVKGPVVWNGKDEIRHYAFDRQEFGWRVQVTLEGNNPEMDKKVNSIIDEELTKLAGVLVKHPDDAKTLRQ